MDSAKQKKAALSIPNILQYLPMAVGFVQYNASLRGFEKEQLNSIELAAEEAISNVIQHAFRPEEEAIFSVICEQIPRGLKIIVKDKGIPFDPMVLPEYEPQPKSEKVPESGLGWYLMQRSMDEIIFHNLGPEGKEIHLIKYLYEDETDDRQEGTASAETVKLAPTPFKVRKARPEDAIEIAKCAYDAYGYSYKAYIYFPERLNEMIANGGILSAVAVTKNEKEEVIAHGALVFEEPGEKIAELGMAFTRSDYQGQGCGKKIGAFLVKEALKKGLRGLYGYATTSHLYSQRAANKTGARDCCILVGDAPANRKNQNFSTAQGRSSRVYGHLNTRLAAFLKIPLQKKKIYAPAKHQEMIKKIYVNLNEKVNFQAASVESTELPGNSPLIDTYTKPSRLSARIKVKVYGTGVVDQVQRMLRKLCVDKYEVISLHLDLHDPLTAKLTPVFEALGFFFIGVIPGAKSGDKLVLQYLNNILIDYESIHLYTDFAKELLAYIKKRDPIRNALS